VSDFLSSYTQNSWTRDVAIPTLYNARMPSPADHLREFIAERMRMSHIYQPVMLNVLLERGGRATIREIASAILGHDESQIEYYEQIVKNMPGRVLASHGVVQRVGDAFELTDAFRPAAGVDREDVQRLCLEAINKFKERRGDAIWQHRLPGLGMIPGSVRYNTLKRAAFRCELCGISADERALDVDHILPRRHGGTDDPENLQALCWKCNGDKGAGDDVDFRNVKAMYDTRNATCVFCTLPADRVVAENALAILIRDAFPVTDGHLLVLPKRHVPDYFDLMQPERNAIDRLLLDARRRTMETDGNVVAFNVGINSGIAAGQTVMHTHVHLIPRRAGDVPEPRGGVRGVIPAKQQY
jgi:diadenosine tetraphosphate (Ap4A) HIT family hydrolase